jgi:tetratricopeptide (TPR) repeat protein
MTSDDCPGEESEQRLREKIADGSQDPDDYRNLTDLLFPSGHYDEAIALYRRALTLPLTGFKKAQLSMELGWIYYEIGQQEQAAPLAREALSFLPNDSESAEVLYCLGSSQALLSFSDFFAERDDGAEAARLALKWLEKAIADGSQFEDKPHLYIDAARIYCALGDVEKAIVHCESCLNREIKTSARLQCLIIYSQALQQKERFAEAEGAITQAFKYGENYKSGLLHTLHLERGNILRLTNRLAESKASFEQAVAALKSDPYFHSDVEILGEIQLNLATVSYELGDYKEAISACNEALLTKSKDDPSYAAVLYWLGCSYEGSEDLPKARACYIEALALSSATEDDKILARKRLPWVLAKLEYLSGKYTKAVTAFKEIISHYTKDDADYSLSVLWLASSYEGLGDHDKARSFYEETLDSRRISDANRSLARNGLARSLANLAYQSGDYKHAAEKFEEVLDQYPDSDPKHWNIFIWLASCYQGMGNYAKAQDCCKKVLVSRHATDHDKTLARRRLTSSLGKESYESQNYSEAIAAFEEVLASCSEDDADRFHALVCLGYGCLRIKSYGRARECFEQVIKSPHAPEGEKAAARQAMTLL